MSYCSTEPPDVPVPGSVPGRVPRFRLVPLHLQNILQHAGVVNIRIVFLGGYLFERFDMFD